MITTYESFNEKLIIDDIMLNESFIDIKNRLANYNYQEEPMNLSVKISQNKVTAYKIGRAHV